jgi:antitoxin VapB
VVLESVPQDWAWLDALAGPVDEDFQQASAEQAAPVDRPELDALFK